MSNQQTQRNFTPCYRKCGTPVTYDEAHKAASGKKIPLVYEADSVGQKKLVPHDCPNYVKKEQPVAQQPAAQPVQPQQQASQTRTVASLTSTDILTEQIAHLAKQVEENTATIEELVMASKQQNALLVALSNTVNKRQ